MKSNWQLPPFLQKNLEWSQPHTRFPIIEQMPHGECKIVAPGIVLYQPADLSQTPTHHLISCGVHGDETIGIEIVEGLYQQLAEGDWNPKHPLMFVIANLEAIFQGARYTQDGYDLNRLFNGGYQTKGKSTYENRRAQELEERVAQFFEPSQRRIHCDLHASIRASQYPLFAIENSCAEPGMTKQMRALLAACGIQAILVSEHASSSFSSFTGWQHEACAYTIELEQLQQFGKNNKQVMQTVQNHLQGLTTDEWAPLISSSHSLQLFHVSEEPIRQEGELKLLFPSDMKNFSPLINGKPYAQNADTTLVAKEGDHLLFPQAFAAVGEKFVTILRPYSE